MTDNIEIACIKDLFEEDFWCEFIAFVIADDLPVFYRKAIKRKKNFVNIFYDLSKDEKNYLKEYNLYSFKDFINIFNSRDEVQITIEKHLLLIKFAIYKYFRKDKFIIGNSFYELKLNKNILALYLETIIEIIQEYPINLFSLSSMKLNNYPETITELKLNTLYFILTHLTGYIHILLNEINVDIENILGKSYLIETIYKLVKNKQLKNSLKKKISKIRTDKYIEKQGRPKDDSDSYIIQLCEDLSYYKIEIGKHKKDIRKYINKITSKQDLKNKEPYNQYCHRVKEAQEEFKKYTKKFESIDIGISAIINKYADLKLKNGTAEFEEAIYLTLIDKYNLEGYNYDQLKKIVSRKLENDLKDKNKINNIISEDEKFKKIVRRHTQIVAPPLPNKEFIKRWIVSDFNKDTQFKENYINSVADYL